MKRSFTFLGLILLALNNPVAAGESGSTAKAASTGKTMETPAPAPEKDWSAVFRVDGWIMQANIGIADTAIGANKDVFLGFGKIIEHVDWLVPIGADFRYKRLGFMPDLVAAKLSGAGESPGKILGGGPLAGRLYTGTDIDLKMVVLNLVAYYRVVEEKTFSIDILGGARLLYLDMNLTFNGGLFPTLTSNTHVNLWDGVGGLRYTQNIGNRFYASLYGDAGTGNTRLTWQIWAGLGYRFTKHLSASAGYRYETWDQGNGPADFRLTLSGPTIDLNWQF